MRQHCFYVGWSGCGREPPPKEARTGARRERGEEERVQELAGAVRALNEEFAKKERLSHEQAWCVPIPYDRKVNTAQDFYKAFHDVRTLPILTCMFWYRKLQQGQARGHGVGPVDGKSHREA